MNSLSHVQLFATPWNVAYQAPPFMGFFRQEYWSGLPFPSPGALPNPGIEPGSQIELESPTLIEPGSQIEPGSPALQADALPSKPPGKPLG